MKETEAEGGQREVEVRISAGGGGGGVLAEFFSFFFSPRRNRLPRASLFPGPLLLRAFLHDTALWGSRNSLCPWSELKRIVGQEAFPLA